MIAPPERRSPKTAALIGAALLVVAWLMPLFGSGAEAVVVVPPAEDPRVPEERSGALRDRLATAEVRHGDTRCGEWTGTRWTCGLQPWLWVGRHRGRVTDDAGARWRRCIWAHPRSEGGTAVPLTIRFPKVPLGDALYGEAALLDAPRTGGPVDLTVAVGDRQRARLRLQDPDGRRRWSTWSAALGEAAGTSADVTFEIRARDASWRHVCFTAFTGDAP